MVACNCDERGVHGVWSGWLIVVHSVRRFVFSLRSMFRSDLVPAWETFPNGGCCQSSGGQAHAIAGAVSSTDECALRTR